MFIDTLQPPLYEKMVGNVSSNFLDLVIIEERIEMGMRKGKIALEEEGGRNKYGRLNSKTPTLPTVNSLSRPARNLAIPYEQWSKREEQPDKSIRPDTNVTRRTPSPFSTKWVDHAISAEASSTTLPQEL
ncbi:hypothetical protein CR513_36027, partial [Mucuna pruriens]